MKNEIKTTPEQVADYVTWIINDFIIKIQSKSFELETPTLKKAEAFRNETIKSIKAGALKDATQNYKDLKELLYYVDEAKEFDK